MTQLYDNAQPTVGGYRDVDVAQLATGPAPGVRMVDVREPHEFTGILGHIEGAELIPLGTVLQQAQDWPRDADLLLICRSGGRSAKAATQLAGLGFTRLMNLRGGMLAWNTARLPVVRPAQVPVPTLAQVRDELMARLHTIVAPEGGEDTRSSREALTVVLQSLQAAPPPQVRDGTSMERLLREMQDLLAAARSGER